MAKKKRLEIIIESVDRTQRGIGSALTRVAKLGTAVGVSFAGAAVGGMALFLRREFEMIDRTAKVADRLGVSTEALSSYVFAAELAGVETSKLELGWQRMARRLAEAAEGSGEAEDALRKLGLDAAELVELAPDEMFERITEALRRQDSARRLALAQKIFDSEGVELLQLMALNMDEVRRRAERLGLTFDRVDAARVEQANDALTEMGFALRGIFIRAAPEIANLVTAVAGVGTEMIASADLSGALVRGIQSAAEASLELKLIWNDLVGLMNIGQRALLREVRIPTLERQASRSVSDIRSATSQFREGGGFEGTPVLITDLFQLDEPRLIRSRREMDRFLDELDAMARESQSALRDAREELTTLRDAFTDAGTRQQQRTRVREFFEGLLERIDKAAEEAAARAEGRARSNRNLLLGGARAGSGSGRDVRGALINERFLQGPPAPLQSEMIELQREQLETQRRIRSDTRDIERTSATLSATADDIKRGVLQIAAYFSDAAAASLG